MAWIIKNNRCIWLHNMQRLVWKINILLIKNQTTHKCNFYSPSLLTNCLKDTSGTKHFLKNGTHKMHFTKWSRFTRFLFYLFLKRLAQRTESASSVMYLRHYVMWTSSLNWKELWSRGVLFLSAAVQCSGSNERRLMLLLTLAVRPAWLPL